ncbi:MAG: XkdX family protein [Spirochaetales bacterium]|nr:XkdX family protein [Spirochaetales bacterium]MBQ7645208.1 XkdX family protein [Spirochaetales bacterium]
MSRAYETIKGFYDEGTWDKTRVRQAVVKGRITAEEYKLITGEDY